MANLLFTLEKYEDWRAVPADVDLTDNVLFIKNISAEQFEAIEDYCLDIGIEFHSDYVGADMVLTYDISEVIEPDEFFTHLILYLEEN